MKKIDKNELLSSGELVRLAQKELEWKKLTKAEAEEILKMIGRSTQKRFFS